MGRFPPYGVMVTFHAVRITLHYQHGQKLVLSVVEWICPSYSLSLITPPTLAEKGNAVEYANRIHRTR